MLLGHELAGVTDDGTAVAIEALFGCGECEQCVQGHVNLCVLGPTALGRDQRRRHGRVLHRAGDRAGAAARRARGVRRVHRRAGVGRVARLSNRGRRSRPAGRRDRWWRDRSPRRGGGEADGRGRGVDRGAPSAPACRRRADRGHRDVGAVRRRHRGGRHRERPAPRDRGRASRRDDGGARRVPARRHLAPARVLHEGAADRAVARLLQPRTAVATSRTRPRCSRPIPTWSTR